MKQLYYHPFSPYSRKVLVAIAEKGITDVEKVRLNPGDPADRARIAEKNPMGKVPVLVLDDWTIPESSIIIEYLDTHYDTGTRLIPEDPDLARQARFFDRIGDLYLIDNIGPIAIERFKPDGVRDDAKIARLTEKSREVLALHEGFAAQKKPRFMLGDSFTMADISSGSALVVAEHMLGWNIGEWPTLERWYRGMTDRPSFQGAIAEMKELMAAMRG